MGRKSRAKQERRRMRMAQKRAQESQQRYSINAEHSGLEATINQSEKYLQDLCNRTFLSLWSYPNPYQGPNRKGKEVCDLLVVFENHIIIFSDKQCKFQDSGNLEQDWARWYRQAIEDSVRQLWGAERWIRNNPERVFLDRHCTKQFPIPLKTTAETTFHRVVVAHGAATRCTRELGGSGSLMVGLSGRGPDRTLARDQSDLPFLVGQADSSKGYVHILDDTTLPILLETLDTVADFTAYLKKKESFIESGIAFLAAGEEEFLAYYLTHLNAEGEYDFVLDNDFNGVAMDEGHWKKFSNSRERKTQVANNRISYIWDEIIEKFICHFRKGTSQYLSHTDFSSIETILRFFARESRLKRRMLVLQIVDMIKNTPPGFRRLRVVPPDRSGDPYWVFLVFPQLYGQSEDDYRSVRQRYLQACCRVVRLDNPAAVDVVGLATETSGTLGRSEDAVYFDGRLWTEEIERTTRIEKDELKILIEVKRIQGVVYDYRD